MAIATSWPVQLVNFAAEARAGELTAKAGNQHPTGNFTQLLIYKVVD